MATIDLTPEQIAQVKEKTTKFVVPIPMQPGGYRPRISDGFAHRGDLSKRNGVGHRGVDLMWRRTVPAFRPEHPYGSRWHWVPKLVEHRPVFACGPGLVSASGERREGGRLVGQWVAIEHGDGLGTAYHHLAATSVRFGDEVEAGQVIGYMGGSPTGYGLIHLHLDVALNGKFFDSAPFVREWRVIGLSELGRVNGE